MSELRETVTEATETGTQRPARAMFDLYVQLSEEVQRALQANLPLPLSIMLAYEAISLAEGAGPLGQLSASLHRID